MRASVTWVALVGVLGQAVPAQASKLAWCQPQRDGKPECASSPGYADPADPFGFKTVHQWVPNACGSGVGLNLVYPDLVALPVGVKLAPVILMHGGGAETGYVDKHNADRTNPYWELAQVLAHKGVIVVQPVFPINAGSGGVDQPWTNADKINAALTCLGQRTGAMCDLRGGCLPDLSNRLNWDELSRPDLVYVGHSNGAVIGLYLPEKMTGLKALVMIDPSKETWLGDLPDQIAATTTMVHLYPDWYGPHHNAGNQLFRLGLPQSCVGGTDDKRGCDADTPCAGGAPCNGPAPVAGKWIPIGYRDFGSVWDSEDQGPGGGLCDPDQGCHASHHCSPFTNNNIVYQVGSTYGINQNGHEAYCGSGGGGTGCTKPAVNCGGAMYCGQATRCTWGPIKTQDSAATWIVGSSPSNQNSTQRLLERYVASYASCFAANQGAYYQPWVTGKDRDFDDAGAGAECTSLEGESDAACGVHTNQTACRSAGCHWAVANDGRAIRVNNGERVTEYDYSAAREYTAMERYNTTGTCETGPRFGTACTTDAFCADGAIPHNCTAGDFTERIESSGIDSIACKSGAFIPMTP